MINDAIVTKSATASGVVTSSLAYLLTDADMLVVLIVGAIAFVTYFVKEFTVKHFKDTGIQYIVKLLVSSFTSFALVGLIFYAGRDGFNQHLYDVGLFFWLFLAFLAGLNPKVTFSLLNKGIEFITSWKK